MAQQVSRQELEKALRLSRRALPIGVGFAVVALGVLWGLHLWLSFPSWIAWGLSGGSVSLSRHLHVTLSNSPLQSDERVGRFAPSRVRRWYSGVQHQDEDPNVSPR
jgi:hypothetical protein